MYIGYNTNGFAHHLLEDAIAIIADIGYRGVALTLDYHALNPYAADFTEQFRRVDRLLEKHNLRCVIETGARYLLDPLRKHAPTLLDPSPAGRERRLDFLFHAIDLADALHADAVSFWSGARPPGLDDEAAMKRLADGCARALERAEPHLVRLAFEPEPGMFIDTMARFAELRRRLNHPLFGLTLDVGHVHCLADGSVAGHVRAEKDHLFNIHIEDMKQGAHDHLPFGEGDIEFAPVFAELRSAGYAHGVYVELSRHSHAAVETARNAFSFLQSLAG